jgi:hypothetical protein
MKLLITQPSPALLHMNVFVNYLNTIKARLSLEVPCYRVIHLESEYHKCYTEVCNVLPAWH